MSARSAPSARGLFRAMGKRAKAAPQLFADGEIAVTDERAREANDFYPTPAEPTLAFAYAERDRLHQFDVIWEPACGDGAMMRDLASLGHDVVGSDLVDRGCGAQIVDFFDLDAPLARAIVTNPPYDQVNWRDGKGWWIRHAIDRLGVDYMALLLNWSWPAAGGLAPLWNMIPPARIYLLRWKIDFTGRGAPPMLNAWFVWDIQADSDITQLLMLDRSDAAKAAQGALL